MTSHQAQLQALITEIEALLGKSAPRLPWAVSGEAGQQRRVLEEALAYLKNVQQTGSLPQDQAEPRLPDRAIAPVPRMDQALDAEANSQRVLQAVLEEMQYLRAQLIQPLTQEVMSLQQQRETLRNELRQLEIERMNLGEQGELPQLPPRLTNEIVEQLRTSLLEQLTPHLRALQFQMQEVPTLYGTPLDPQEIAANLPQLSPPARLAQLQQIQVQTDEMLLRLDSNLRSIFESLDQSIQSYCDTLNQGLDAMHGLGQQGEVIFRAFINHLAHQLKQESDYLTSSEEGRGRLRSYQDESVTDASPPPPGWDETPPAGSPSANPWVELEEVDLGEVDWDEDIDIDEEVTLFQIDEELSHLPLEEGLAAAALEDELIDIDIDALPDLDEFDQEDRTVIQNEPIAWIGSAPAPDTADKTSITAAAGDSDYIDQIDALQEVLFGEGDLSLSASPATAAGEAAAAGDATFFAQTSLEAALDESLLNIESSPSVPELASPVDSFTFGAASDNQDPTVAVTFGIDTAFEELLNPETASLENLSPNDDSDDIQTPLEMLLGVQGAADLALTETVSLEPDTIASLAELLPAPDSLSGKRLTDPFTTLDESDDTFIPAPADEDLLTPDLDNAATNIEFSLDAATYGQLTSDLSELEGLSPEQLNREPGYYLGDLELAAELPPTPDLVDIDADTLPPVRGAQVDWDAVAAQFADVPEGFSEQAIAAPLLDADVPLPSSFLRQDFISENPPTDLGVALPNPDEDSANTVLDGPPPAATASAADTFTPPLSEFGKLDLTIAEPGGESFPEVTPTLLAAAATAEPGMPEVFPPAGLPQANLDLTTAENEPPPTADPSLLLEDFSPDAASDELSLPDVPVGANLDLSFAETPPPTALDDPPILFDRSLAATADALPEAEPISAEGFELPHEILSDLTAAAFPLPPEATASTTEPGAIFERLPEADPQPDFAPAPEPAAAETLEQPQETLSELKTELPLDESAVLPFEDVSEGAIQSGFFEETFEARPIAPDDVVSRLELGEEPQPASPPAAVSDEWAAFFADDTESLERSSAAKFLTVDNPDAAIATDPAISDNLLEGLFEDLAATPPPAAPSPAPDSTTAEGFDWSSESLSDLAADLPTAANTESREQFLVSERLTVDNPDSAIAADQGASDELLEGLFENPPVPPATLDPTTQENFALFGESPAGVSPASNEAFNSPPETLADFALPVEPSLDNIPLELTDIDPAAVPPTTSPDTLADFALSLDEAANDSQVRTDVDTQATDRASTTDTVEDFALDLDESTRDVPSSASARVELSADAAELPTDFLEGFALSLEEPLLGEITLPEPLTIPADTLEDFALSLEVPAGEDLDLPGEAAAAATLEDFALSLEEPLLENVAPEAVEILHAIEEDLPITPTAPAWEENLIADSIASNLADITLEDWPDATEVAGSEELAPPPLTLGDLELNLSLHSDDEAMSPSTDGAEDLFASFGDQAIAAPDESLPPPDLVPNLDLDREIDLAVEAPTAQEESRLATDEPAAPREDSFNSLLDSLLAEIPDYDASPETTAGEPASSEVGITPMDVTDLEPPLWPLAGSPEAGFSLGRGVPMADLEQALALIPDNDEPLAMQAQEPTAIAPENGFPPPVAASLEHPTAPVAAADLTPYFDLEGNVDEGFQLSTTTAETTDLDLALDSIPDAGVVQVAPPENMFPSEDLLIRDFMPSSPSTLSLLPRNPEPAAEEASSLISAADLGFPTDQPLPPLADIGDYDPEQSWVPEPTAAPPAAASTFVSAAAVLEMAAGLPLSGSEAEGFTVEADDEVDYLLVEALRDVPNNAPFTAEAATSIPPDMLLGDIPDAFTNPSLDPAAAPAAAAIAPPTLELAGSYETGFEIAESDSSSLDILESALADLGDPGTATQPLATDYGMLPLEDLIVQDLAPSPMVPEDEPDTAPLSDEELADLFPPQVDAPVSPEGVPLSAAALDQLFDDAESIDELSWETAEDEPEALASEVSPAAELAETTFPEEDAAVLISETEFADLFPPTLENSEPAESLAPIDFDIPVETAEVSATDLEASVDIDLPNPAAAASDRSFAGLFDDVIAASPYAPAESADWDPLAADFNVDAAAIPSDSNRAVPPAEAFWQASNETPDSRESIPFEELNLAMEEISTTEIENDEAFRSAFQEDFAPDLAELPEPQAMAADLDFDLTAATAATEDTAALPPELAAADSPDAALLEQPSGEDTGESIGLAAAIAELPTPQDLQPTLPPLDLPTAPFEDDAVFLAGGALASLPAVDAAAGEPPFDLDAEPPEDEWFLGIDLGTTGISGVLMNPASGSAHPLYWSRAASGKNKEQATFRLPLVAAFRQSTAPSSGEWELQSVGFSALSTHSEAHDLHLLSNLKPLLKVGIPHQTSTGNGEPLLQWTDHHTMPLQQVIASLQALLVWLQQPSEPDFTLEAVGLEADELHTILSELQGLVVGHPCNWSDTYRFNVREAILGAGLVENAGQIFFVEEAIAAVLSGLPDPHAPLPEQNRQVQTLYQCDWQGGTVVISAGASCTEVGLANIPQPLAALSREDFALRNFAYGGEALELDIICQLLVPPERRQSRPPGDRRTAKTSGWSWQATLPEVVNAQWESLGLEAMDLPQLAEPDHDSRIRLRQHLESSRLGQSLLEAARYLKLILQNQNQFQLELADQSWKVLRRDLESRILVPYIQRLNQQLNALLSQTGQSSQGINQVICTGGNASFSAIAKWLRQKFPNATIIQDTYPTNRPLSCSRVAYGLVNLCRYPQVLDVPRHQYSDYFLLSEIVHTLPENPLPLTGILHLLEEHGINTDVCRPRVEAILEGHLPPGLVPDSHTRAYLSRDTLTREAYQELTRATLFSQQTRQIYMLNPPQRDRIRAHLATLLENKQQTLAEPLIAQLVTPWF